MDCTLVALVLWNGLSLSPPDLLSFPSLGLFPVSTQAHGQRGERREERFKSSFSLPLLVAYIGQAIFSQQSHSYSRCRLFWSLSWGRRYTN